MSNNRIISSVAYFYVYFFRGTPLIAQVFLIYYGVGSFNKELQSVGLVGILPRSLVLRPVGVCTQYRRLSG